MNSIGTFHGSGRARNQILFRKSSDCCQLRQDIFHHDKGRQSLNSIPKCFRKEIFNRLVHKGVLEKPQFSSIIDVDNTEYNFKLVSNFDDESSMILYIVASPTALCSMFFGMHPLSTLEITKTSTFNDSVMSIIAENCPCLKILNVSGTDVGDEGVFTMASNYFSYWARY